MVNINSINFNSKYSIIAANVKETSSGQDRIIVPYKVDTDSDGNIMPLHIYQKIFTGATKEYIAATKDENIKLKMQQYNNKTTGQM